MSTMMRRDAWRAINVIADMCAAAGGDEGDYPTVRQVLGYHVDGDALIWLDESMGYASAVNGHDKVGMARTVRGQIDGGRHDPAVVQACLTPAGVSWWHHDPHQAILRIVTYGAGRVRLSEPALADHGEASVEAFEGMLEAGLITVTHTPTGQTPTTSQRYTAHLIGKEAGALYTAAATKLGKHTAGL